jgi:hypothetical protein
MVVRNCFTFGVFCVVAVLVAALTLRDANSHLFYRLRLCQVDENHLKQQLWQKQLQLESMTHPGRLLQPVPDPTHQ